MAPPSFEIHADITRAETLPAGLYHEASWFDRLREDVLPTTWQLCPDGGPFEAGQILPWMMLEGTLSEPVLWTRDGDGKLACLSNVCTHRGTVMVKQPRSTATIRCPYHGRCFRSDGRFVHMPEFEGARDFPSTKDDLPRLSSFEWGPLRFASIRPDAELAPLLKPLQELVGFMPLESLTIDETRSRDYEFEANWLLYIDNYLEGFHVPFVHPGLARTLDFASYSIELLPRGVLQRGRVSANEHAFDLPSDHPDFGQGVGAYYYWLFPNTMLNFYPWGLSVNVVQPLSPTRTRVLFRSFVADPAKQETGAGAQLDVVELEDEEIVMQVQQGVRSALYHRGRYSPKQELGVHHFHRLLAKHLER